MDCPLNEDVCDHTDRDSTDIYDRSEKQSEAEMPGKRRLIKVDPDPGTKIRNEEVIRLYAEGHSLRTVGKQIGMSMANVRYVLKVAGITLRPVGAPRKVQRSATKLISNQHR